MDNDKEKKKVLRWPGVEPGSTAWKATMLTVTPPTLGCADRLTMTLLSPTVVGCTYRGVPQ